MTPAAHGGFPPLSAGDSGKGQGCSLCRFDADQVRTACSGLQDGIGMIVAASHGVLTCFALKHKKVHTINQRGGWAAAFLEIFCVTVTVKQYSHSADLNRNESRGKQGRKNPLVCMWHDFSRRLGARSRRLGLPLSLPAKPPTLRALPDWFSGIGYPFRSIARPVLSESIYSYGRCCDVIKIRSTSCYPNFASGLQIVSNGFAKRDAKAEREQAARGRGVVRERLVSANAA